MFSASAHNQLWGHLSGGQGGGECHPGVRGQWVPSPTHSLEERGHRGYQYYGEEGKHRVYIVLSGC